MIASSEIRGATTLELGDIARLHRSRISEGFLSSLGEPFLRRLYRRVLASDDSFVLVAHGDGRTLGFCAISGDVKALYQRFVVRDGVVAGVRAAPRLIANARRVLETLRYPSTMTDLPRAELLAVAVDADAGGRGIGRSLVDASTERALQLGVHELKVVTGADNDAALGLYRGCGFVSRGEIAVHEGTPSQVLVWSSS